MAFDLLTRMWFNAKTSKQPKAAHLSRSCRSLSTLPPLHRSVCGLLKKGVRSQNQNAALADLIKTDSAAVSWELVLTR